MRIPIPGTSRSPSGLGLWCAAVILVACGWLGFMLSLPRAVSQNAIKPEDWIPVDIPCEPPEVECRDAGTEITSGFSLVDLPLAPDAPLQLLVSSLGDGNRYFETRLTSSELHSLPMARPRPVAADHDGGLNPSRIAEHDTLQMRMSGGAQAALPAEIKGDPPAQRQFWLHVTADPLESRAGYVQVKAELICHRPHVQIYVDSSQANQPYQRSRALEIAELVESDVLPSIQSRWGAIRHVDGDRRLTVFMTPWLGRLRGGTTQVKGFTRGTDFQTDLTPPYSNQAAILYLNSDLPTGLALKTLLLHELTHAAIFSQNFDDCRNGMVVDDWLNEGLAHLTERSLGGDWSNLDYRVARFFQTPQNSPLIISDYYRSSRWRDHGCRGAAFLYLNENLTQGSGPSSASFTGLLRWGGKVRQTALLKSTFREWTVALARSSSILKPASVPTAEMSHSNFSPNVAPASEAQVRVGQFLNSGPRFTVWNVSELSEFPLKVAGTATQFIELRSLHSGWFRLKVPRESLEQSWQVTVLKSAPGRPVISVSALWESRPESGSGDTSRADSSAQYSDLVVRLTGRLSPGWNWSTLACESADDQLPRTQIWRLDSDGSATPSLTRTFRSDSELEFRIRRDVVRAGKVLKVCCADRTNRIQWAWCDIPECEPIQVTTQVATKAQPVAH